MSQPQTINLNLQINIFPDGRVEVVPQASTPTSKSASPKAVSQATNSTPSATTSVETQSPTASSPPATASSSPASGPSDSDLRAALLRVAKATSKAEAVAVLQEIAGVERLPEVAPEHFQAIIDRWNVMVEEASKAPAETPAE